MTRLSFRTSIVFSLAFCAFAGCRSPYYADRGAGLGALAGAGAGAIIGHQTGNAGAGALLGGGLGALTGGAVGTGMDEMAAQNRAQIASQLGRQVQTGAANMNEVLAMSQAGVDPTLIQNYVRTSGVTRPLTAAEVISLHNQGVNTNVIQAMQNPTVPNVPVVAGRPPILVEEYYYGGGHGCYNPHFGYYRGRQPRTSFGISISN
ncbi:MAG: hypothetical protein GXP28_04700 [Planctomycetes bacterium]|nr:hypothetical protein [Planctomycetota bacterium]